MLDGTNPEKLPNDEQIARLLAIINNASDFIGIADKDGYSVFVNQAGRKMMGFSADEDLSSLHISAYHSAETYQELQDEGIPTAIKAGVWKGESEFLTRNGVIVHTLQTIVLHRNQEGEIQFFSTIARDIGQLKQQSRELLESQERYQSLFNNTQNGVAVYKAVNDGNDFLIVDFNHSAEKIEGIKRRDIVGQHVSEVFSGILSMGLLNVLKRVWTSGNSESFPITAYADDKISGWRANYVYPLNNGEVVVTYHDDTPLKQAEEQLYASELQKQLILQYLPDLVWLKDTNGVYLACNPVFERFFGALESEIVGKSDYDFIDKELADFFCFHDKQAIKAGKATTNEEWITFADNGHKALLQTTRTPLKEPNGKVLGVLGIGHEVTEYKNNEEQLKRSQQALRDNESRFRGFFEKNSSVMLLIQPATGEIVAANDAAVKYYGYSQKQLLTKKISQINMLPAQQVAAERAAALQEKRNYFHFPHRLASGEIRDVEVYSTPIKSEGKDLLFSIIHDITARRCAEKSLEFHLLFQKKATEISIRFLSVRDDSFDHAIDISLAELGILFEVDRSYLFMFSENLETMSNTHEWCAEGIEQQIDRIQELPSDALPDFFRQIKKAPVHIPNVEEVSESMAAEKQEWQEQQIQSLICIPVFGVQRQILGFIGFDAVANSHFWPDDQIAMLQVLTDIIGGAIERQRTEAKLQLAASVFTNAREGIIITDPHGVIIDVNTTFCELTGYELDEILGKNLRMFKSLLQSKEFYLSLWDDLVNKGHWAGELWNRKKSGKIYAQMATISAVCDSSGKTKHYVGLFSDITAQKQQQRQLEHIAHYDALTNLPNRILLADRMLQSMRQAKRHDTKLAVVYIDLDGFKEVNDNFGHDIGDKLLVSVSRFMQENLREEDTISRLGGDEFVAVLINLKHQDESTPLLIRLLQAVSQPIDIESNHLQVSASLGVTFYPQNEEVDADQLLRQADQSMYQAKLSGKNRYQLFDEAQARSIRVHNESIERINQAVIDNELILYYQPKVNMRSGKVIGVEALLRWQHPQRGILPPVEFLPMVKNHPLAIEIDNWVIKQALIQLGTWQEQALRLPISINISPNYLQKSDFAEQLQTILAMFPHIDPCLLELEVLESSAFEDIQKVSELITSCREIGIEFALDDFGTGYSSLSYLQRLPASLLKIDQSFIRFILENPDDLAIIEAILSLARAFNRKVIAEGVETIEHGDILLQIGCELGQGYGIARPMPADAIDGWIRQWQPDPRWLQAKTIARENFSLLFFEIKHRSWVNSVVSFLNNQSTFVPELDHHKCMLGAWLDDEGKRTFGDMDSFQDIQLIHRQLHEIAEKLLSLKQQEVTDTVIEEGIETLKRLKGEITDKLRELMT